MVENNFCEFVTVRGRRKGRKGKRGQNALTAENFEVTSEKIERIISSRMSRSLKNYSEVVIAAIESVLNGRKLAQIHAFGVGSFHWGSEPGCEQVALLVLLSNYFSCFTCFQDPCSIDAEKLWLKNNGIEISETIDLLNDRCSKDDASMVLFYAPHCSHPMYNSLIYAHRNDLHRFILLGNSTSFIDSSLNLDLGNMEKKQEIITGKKKSERSRFLFKNGMLKELPALCYYREICQEIKLETFDENYSAFNDLSLLYVVPEIALESKNAISNDPPCYRYFANEIILKLDADEQ